MIAYLSIAILLAQSQAQDLPVMSSMRSASEHVMIITRDSVAICGKQHKELATQSLFSNKFELEHDELPCISMTRDGMVCAISEGDTIVVSSKLIQPENAEPKFITIKCPGVVRAIRVTPDGRRIGVRTNEQLLVFDSDTGASFRTVMIKSPVGRTIPSLSWNVQGTKLLVTEFKNKSAWLLDIQSNQVSNRESDSACFVNDQIVSVISSNNSDNSEYKWRLENEGHIPFTQFGCPVYWRRAFPARVQSLDGNNFLAITIGNEMRLPATAGSYTYLLDTSDGWHQLLTISEYANVIYVEDQSRAIEAICELSKKLKSGK